MKRIFYLFFLLLLLISISAQKKVTFESLYSFENVGNLKLSPKNNLLAYTLSKTNIETGGFSGALWIMNFDGSNKKMIKEGAFNPNWISNGDNLIFTASENNKMQIFSYDVKTEKIKALTDLEAGISNYAWSPLNNAVLIRANVYRDKITEEESKNKKHTGLLYDKLLIRPGSSWDNGMISNLFYYNLETKEYKNVTPGQYNAPTSHLGGNDVEFSPNGKQFVYTMNQDINRAYSTNNDIFISSIDGSKVEKLTDNQSSDINPTFSPNGKFLAYTEMDSAKYEADLKDLIILDLSTKTRKNLTKSFDYSIDRITWSKNSDAVFIQVKEKGFDSIYKIDIKTGKFTNIIKNVAINNVNISTKEDLIYCIKSSVDRPAEIFSYNIMKKEFNKLTNYTDEFVNTHKIPKTEVIWYKGAYDDSVMCFLTYPANFDKNKKYPLIYLFHGGPEATFDGSWSAYVANSNYIASRDYFVIKPNIHGSTSYGEKFHKAILNNWGIVDLEDVLKSIEFLKQNYPSIDTERIGASGRSYGGFLVNWLNAKTNKFKCFVSVAGIFDMLAFYYSTDELWFPEVEFGGTMFDRRNEYIRTSPVTYVNDMKTPTLVSCGGRDFRVDESQSIGMFTALQRKGIDSKFLYFPDEPHYYRRVNNWKYFYEQQFEWFDKYLKK